MKPLQVVVLSPSNYSLYSLAVLSGLRRAGMIVSGVGLRRIINLRRLISEGRRDGSRLLVKIWNKLLWRNQVFESATEESMSKFLKDNDISLETVTRFCRGEEILLRRCSEFNEPGFVDWVRSLKPDAIVFTGGGLIRERLLHAAPKGVVNCHMGILPMYRGMDLPEWAILNRDFGQIGCTVHVMDSGIDTGDILATFRTELKNHDTFKSLRGRIEYTMCSAIVDTTVDYLHGRIERRSQSVSEGKQFFIMHPDLAEIAYVRLQEAVHS